MKMPMYVHKEFHLISYNCIITLHSY